MAGLARLCRAYGRIQVGSVMWVWDYANEKPMHEKDMPDGSETWKVSEKAKYEKMKLNSDKTEG